MDFSSFDQQKIVLTLPQKEQFELFLKIFMEKNAVINLSAIRDEENIILKHFLDSCLIFDLLPYKEAKNIIDVGTGGGFPGLPLAILSPEKNFTLIDSVGKKVKAVQSFVQELGLKNVKCIQSRAEEIGHDSHFREKFDLVVSRAVAFLPTLVEYVIPLIRVKGYCIAYKEASAEEKDRSHHSVTVLQSRLIAEKKYTLPHTDHTRSFMIFQKDAKTSSQYPRTNGIPLQNPL